MTVSWTFVRRRRWSEGNLFIFATALIRRRWSMRTKEYSMTLAVLYGACANDAVGVTSGYIDEGVLKTMKGYAERSISFVAAYPVSRCSCFVRLQAALIWEANLADSSHVVIQLLSVLIPLSRIVLTFQQTNLKYAFRLRIHSCET